MDGRENFKSEARKNGQKLFGKWTDRQKLFREILDGGIENL